MSDALFDSYMLQNFPGKTLEEIDQIDILRFFRAMDARSVENIETQRRSQIKGKVKASEISKEIIEKFTVHDKMFKEFEEHLNNGKK